MKSKIYTNLGRWSEEYSLVALVSKESSQQLLQELEGLAGAYSDSIYRLSGGQLHITISAIVRDITFGKDTKSYFDAHQVELIQKINDVLVHWTPFKISFGSFEVREEAVIAKGHETTMLNGLRNAIVDSLKLPYKPATIAHISCVRYKKEFDLTDLSERAESTPLDFVETIANLYLVRETRQPLQEYSIVHTFEL